MLRILTPKEMQAVDRHMIEEQGIPGLVLMEHAAMGVTRAVLEKGAKRVLILCGGGNNGGDGLSVLRQLAMRGVEAEAVLLSAPEALLGDARKQYEMAVGSGLCVKEALDEAAVGAIDMDAWDMLVDALFGTGLARDIGGRYRLAVMRMNETKKPIIAVDIPSGVDGKTGAVLGVAVRADTTVTFQYKKRGHLLLPGREYAGELRVVPIGLPALRLEQALEEWTEQDVDRLLPERPIDSHKGKNGRALLMAGSTQYMGATLMSAMAALRTGCGLLHVAVPGVCIDALRHCPAAIAHPAGKGGEWDAEAVEAAAALMEQMDVLALGPGMGGGEGVPALLKRALITGKPLLIDADGLNAIARHAELLSLLHGNVALTPHPGEMGRLTGLSTAEITACPVAVAMEYAQLWGCTLLLKGATTVIARPGRCALSARGNSGLAKGGSGDVLTGITLALMAQGADPYSAACAGAYLLGAKAEEAYRLLKTRLLLPTDVIEALKF